MAEQFADHHLNILRLSILGTDNSDLSTRKRLVWDSQAQLPKELAKLATPACAGVQAGKSDLWLNRSFKGYPDTPVPDVYDLEVGPTGGESGIRGRSVYVS